MSQGNSINHKREFEGDANSLFEANKRQKVNDDTFLDHSQLENEHEQDILRANADNLLNQLN